MKFSHQVETDVIVKNFPIQIKISLDTSCLDKESEKREKLFFVDLCQQKILPGKFTLKTRLRSVRQLTLTGKIN